MTLSDRIDWSVLSGPDVSRRTMMKLAMATGAIPFASWLAACGDDDDADDEGATTGGGEATATEAADAGDAADETEESSGDTVTGTAVEASPMPDEGAKTGGTLRMGYGTISQILTLDPAQVTQGVVAGELVANLFSSLVQFDEELGLHADLAEDWTVSDDGTEYTFNLREGLKFHNDEPLTAESFVYTYERTINPDFASPHANKLELVTELTAADDVTLNIVLSEPFAPFLAVACSRGPGRALTPISQSAVEEMGDEEFGLSPVGCGPFKMVQGSREVGAGFEMEAFEDWYGGRPFLDKIIIQLIPEPTSQASALAAGDIDMMNQISATSFEELDANDNLTIVQAAGTNWSGMMMNYARPPWDNVTARMAISKAIDRQEYVDRAFFGLATPAHSAIAPAFAWVYHEDDSENPQAFDLEEAKALAEEAGITGMTVSLMALSDDTRTREVIRNILAEIDIDVDIQPLQSAALNERWQAGDFDFHINGSVVDADPDDGHWNFFYSEGPWNTYGYNNPKADELLTLTRSTSDVEERRQAWLDLEKILQTDVAYAFLNHTPDLVAFRNAITGYRPIPEMRYMETVWIDE